MQVEALSQQTDWRGADLPTVRAFMHGTGCDLFDRRQFKRLRAYLRSAHPDPRRRFPYLQRSPDWATVYVPMLEKLRSHLCRGR